MTADQLPHKVNQTELNLEPVKIQRRVALSDELTEFSEFGRRTVVEEFPHTGIPVYINEFWTAKQRQAHRLHEISYRACFKPQLPRFFIERLTKPGDVVFDPFMGRGTTLLEAAFLGRVPSGTDINPLARSLVTPRLNPPSLDQIRKRLSELDLHIATDLPEDLKVFYHIDTLREICSLRAYLIEREAAGTCDPIDAWIRMVALNRLTGHSRGFFSVYTLPPNQAVSIASQKRINERLQQTPDYRDISKLILGKSRSLLSGLPEETRATLARLSKQAKILASSADSIPEMAANTVTLAVTSPPFLNVVDYKTDNWLRCWFAGVSIESIEITMCRKISDWEAAMTAALREVHRILKPGGHVAFEVGEVRNGKIKLEESVVTAGSNAGLTPVLILVNTQEFTKTANCWGVQNNTKGTNTNRIVLFQKKANIS